MKSLTLVMRSSKKSKRRSSSVTQRQILELSHHGMTRAQKAKDRRQQQPAEPKRQTSPYSFKQD